MAEEDVEVVGRGVNGWNAFMRGELSSEAFAEPFDLVASTVPAVFSAGGSG